jgi:hypothetical protein
VFKYIYICTHSTNKEMIKTTLISQDLYSITIGIGDSRLVFSSEGFDIWVHQNHPDTFDKYSLSGAEFNSSSSAFPFFDIIKFNQSENAKRYYLQYLGALINKGIDKWDSVER